MDIRDYRDLGAIIPSFLDDFGLTPAQFRIYGRIARRVGKGGYCSESAQNMAIHCRMNLKTVRSAIKFLESHQLILVERRPGKSPHIALTHSSKWISTSNRPQPKTGIPKTDPTQNESEGVPKMSWGGDPKTGRHPTQNEITKGSLEGVQLKNPIKEFREDQNLIPTHREGEPEGKVKTSLTGEKKDQSTQPTSERKKDNMFRPRQSVPLTANQQAKAMIEEFCDWGRFFKARKAKLKESSYWQNSSARIVEGTILKPYRELLDKSDPRKPWNTETDRAMAIAEVKELIKTHVGELGLNKESATQQAQQGGLNAELVRLIELHKNNPSQALKLARGNPLIYNKFVKQVKTNAS